VGSVVEAGLGGVCSGSRTAQVAMYRGVRGHLRVVGTAPHDRPGLATPGQALLRAVPWTQGCLAHLRLLARCAYGYRSPDSLITMADLAHGSL
jgi:hypothetical protein